MSNPLGRYFLFFAVLILPFAMSSCSGSSSSDSGTDASGAAVSGSSSEDASSSVDISKIDVKKKSDDKGIGRFSSVPLGPIDPKMAEEGKAVFTVHCSACHKPTTERLVGPGLKGVTQRRTPEWIMNMITNPELMTHKDPIAEALLATHYTQMTFQHVTDQQARQILEFFRQNDSKP